MFIVYFTATVIEVFWCLEAYMLIYFTASVRGEPSWFVWTGDRGHDWCYWREQNGVKGHYVGFRGWNRTTQGRV